MTFTLPPSSGPAPESGRTPVFKRPLFVVVVSVLATLIVCVGTGLSIYFGFGTSPPDDVEISLLCPAHLNAGDTFDVEIRVKNLGNRPRVIDSIDVYDGFLTGILIQRSSPRWQSSSHYFGAFVSYDFQLAIPPNGETVVRFHAQALKPGDFMDDWQVCIDSPSSCVSEVLRTVVSESSTE